MNVDGAPAFIRVGDVLKAARIVAGMGGEAPLERFYELWGGYAFAVIKTAQAWGVLRRARRGRGGGARAVLVLGARGISLLGATREVCPFEVDLNGGRLRVSTTLGTFDVELSVSSLLSLAYNLSVACGEDPRVLYDKLRRAVERALKTARGLERWLVRWPLEPGGGP